MFFKGLNLPVILAVPILDLAVVTELALGITELALDVAK